MSSLENNQNWLNKLGIVKSQHWEGPRLAPQIIFQSKYAALSSGVEVDQLTFPITVDEAALSSDVDTELPPVLADWFTASR